MGTVKLLVQTSCPSGLASPKPAGQAGNPLHREVNLKSHRPRETFPIAVLLPLSQLFLDL